MLVKSAYKCTIWRHLLRKWILRSNPSRMGNGNLSFSNSPPLRIRRSLLMPKRKHILRPLDHTYTEQQLAGLRAHTQTQKQNTVERLRTAITSLQAQHKPISTRTIFEECGLSYASFRRNP